MSARVLKWMSLAAGTLVALEIGLYQLWPHLDDNDPPPTLEQQLSIAAGLMVLILPHAIAATGYRGRPWLLKVAGAVALALAMSSFISFATLILAVPLLLIPAIVYLLSSKRSSLRPRVPTPVILILAVAGALAAVASMFLTKDPRCTILVRRGDDLVYEEPARCDPSHSGRLGPQVVGWSGASDTYALHESSLSLLLSVTTLAMCLWAGAPHSPTREALVAAAAKASK